MVLIDYHTKQRVATFEGTLGNKQLNAWLDENDYLVHRKAKSFLIVIKKGI